MNLNKRDCSHGFRPKRGCHTALLRVSQKGRGTKWFIEGDLRACFDKIDHSILLNILREKFHDNRFIRLIERLLKAGYLEDWKYNQTYSGVRQGSIVSPILANLVLDRLDKYVESELIPQYTLGKRRRANLKWNKWVTIDDEQQSRIWNGRSELVQRLLAQECELCGNRENIEVHHIRKLADLERKGRKPRPDWMKKMSARRRKTLVVCRSCHQNIQYGRYDGQALKRKEYGQATSHGRVMCSLEGGGWKSAQTGNSLATYPTSCTVSDERG